MIKHVLIADDDPDDLDLFKEALSEVNSVLVCDAVRDGKELLAWLAHATKHPDVIFIDVNMPEMNGWECLSRVRALDKFAHIPIVVYSTSSARKDGRKAIDLGAVCFFEKPTRYGLIKDFLQVLLTFDSVDKSSIQNAVKEKKLSTLNLVV